MSMQIDIAKENTNVEQISAKLFAGEFNGLPVLHKAANSSGRSSEPPLTAHVLVALSQDGHHLILEKGHQLLSYYTKLLSMLKCLQMQVFLLQLSMVMKLLCLMLL